MSNFSSIFPTFITPQLATIVDTPPDGHGWLHEIKLDGFRLLVRKEGAEIRFFTRNGHDWTGRFPAIAEQVRKLPAARAWLDGELVVLREDGRSCFGSLQRAVARLDQQRLVFCAFDLMHLDKNLCALPLKKRKELLGDAIAGGAWNFRYVDHVDGHGAAFFAAVCDLQLEGVVSKRAGSMYRPGSRSREWQKSKWKGYRAVREVAWKWWEESV